MENNVTDVAPLVRKFEEAERATYEERQRNERDTDYFHGYQITKEEAKTLEKRKQPVVKYNRIRRKVNFLLGMEKQSRRDPKCFPRNPNDDDAADAATDALRYVCDEEDWDAKRSEAWADILVPGTGAVMVGAKNDKYGLTPQLTNIAWDRLFYDPHSRRFDFSDANYMGIVTWYDLDEAKEAWPEAQGALQETVDGARHTETYDDRPKWKLWADYTRKRVRVIEMYYIRQGVWYMCVFTEMGHLQEPQPSPYHDEDGQPENPIKAASLYVDRDNNRYGDVRDLIDPQDEINKRRSKGLHLISMRQARVGTGASMAPERVRAELARPDGIIEGEDVEILLTNDMAAMNFQMLTEAKAEIDLLGANASLQGKNENDMSGRAIMAQQQGGMVEIAVHMDRLRFLTLEVYRAIWARIRQYWDGPRWIRVTDDEKNLRFVGVNQQITAAQQLQEQLESDPEAMQRLQADPGAQQRMQMFLASPMAQQVVEQRNVPTEIDVDIIVDEGMDTPTIQAEQWTELAKLAQTGMVRIPPDMLIQASQLRDKDKLLEMLSQPNPAAEQQQQLELQGKQAEVEKTQSETQENIATAAQRLAQVDIDAFKAGASA
ncbi:MAG TPA: hypothetical protein VF389_11725 [Woeseiaceae bacterium]